MPKLNVTSEIGTLKRVIIHTPGYEIEAMTPKEAERDLYNDIIPLEAVRAEYDRLKSFLSTVASTYEVTDLLAEAIAADGNKFELLRTLATLCPIRNRMDELMAMGAQELSRMTIEGLPSLERNLSSMIDPHSFVMRPLPNAYFMRDSAAVFRGCVLSGATAFDVRLIESIVTRFIFKHHPDFMAKDFILNGPEERSNYITIEGGDFLVLSPTVLAIGVSERTTANAVERVAANAARKAGEPVSVFAVMIPRERATIHLDMVFTMIDRDAALVYGPVVTGRDRARVIRIDANPKGGLSFHEEDGLLQGLKGAGIDLEPVLCGSGHRLYQEREQWLSGANSFAFAPGKIVMYSCNSYTLEALAKAGFAYRKADDFVEGREKAADYGRLVVGFDGIELARGGGGARCMTCPVEREDL
ncbi:MAG: hypothetical protein KBB32_05755 [Spirochaetia bacterium]|nr:hypothetical protein [Spirochaetia bacterium]